MEHATELLPIYPTLYNHWVATNAFESILHQGRFLLQQSETCAEVFTVTVWVLGFCRLFCWIGFIQSSERVGHKTIFFRNETCQKYCELVPTKTLYMYDFSLFFFYWKIDYFHQLVFFFSCSADYKPKKIKTEDIKKAKKRKQEEEEVTLISLFLWSRKARLTIWCYVEQGESDSRGARQGPVWDKAACGRFPPVVQVNLPKP